MRKTEGASILITGGGSGLGESTARFLTERGAKVTITGRREEKLREVAEDIGCGWVAGDVTLADDRQRMIDATVEHGGGIDTLVNNAGNMYRGELEELDEQQLLNIFHTNVVGAMMLTGLATSHLEKSGGSVLFMGSVHARRAFPGASPYASTKAAVMTLSRVLGAELGPKGIRVNCIVPGGVVTEINVRAGLATKEEAFARQASMASIQAMDRLGTGEDIAEAVEYLMNAEWVTGATLDVDGGMGLGVSRD